jgi:3-dehydroquinate dehydratase-2
MVTDKNIKITIVNGPNLNFLGKREPEIYGNIDFAKINNHIKKYCDKNQIDVEFYQNNSEGELINYFQSIYDKVDCIIFNPGAYTHTSVALYDCIKSIETPVIEVHLSNLHSRSESFRRTMITTPACIGQISGFGYKSYLIAIDSVKHYLIQNK